MVKDFAAFMGQDQENIQHPTGGCRDGNENDGDQLFGVVVKKSLPGLS